MIGNLTPPLYNAHVLSIASAAAGLALILPTAIRCSPVIFAIWLTLDVPWWIRPMTWLK
jgi:hypothetical protein